MRLGLPHLADVLEKPGAFNRAAQQLSCTMPNWVNEIEAHKEAGNENPQNLVAGKEVPVEVLFFYLTIFHF